MTALQSRLLNVMLLSAAVGFVLAVGWPAEDPVNPPNTMHMLDSQPPPVSSQEAVRSKVSRSGHPGRLGPDSMSGHSDRSGPSVQNRLAPLDLNQATAEQLQELPGIGETLARRVVHRRETHGIFRSVDDLLEVKGIGRKRLEQLRRRLFVRTLPGSSVRGSAVVPSEPGAM
jgi:competence ComEA-like helix-hairpin-helix protein